MLESFPTSYAGGLPYEPKMVDSYLVDTKEPYCLMLKLLLLFLKLKKSVDG